MLHHTLGLPHELFYVRSVGHTAKALWEKNYKISNIHLVENGHNMTKYRSVC